MVRENVGVYLLVTNIITYLGSNTRGRKGQSCNPTATNEDKDNSCTNGNYL